MVVLAIAKLESLREPLEYRSGPLAERNFNAAKRAFDETKAKE